jgi:hypothetical protein
MANLGMRADDFGIFAYPAALPVFLGLFSDPA